ncbi:hypothetical protein [Nonomuraea insulae]|uniref:Uncharacterized protein n=1 Tax=Nonomuraea insulae TaxID=1616787 RepID=A0ABW1D2X5_9ACTN
MSARTWERSITALDQSNWPAVCRSASKSWCNLSHTPCRRVPCARATMRHVQGRGGLAGYLLVGAGTYGPHHSPTFDLDEAALGPVAGLLAALIRS